MADLNTPIVFRAHALKGNYTEFLAIKLIALIEPAYPTSGRLGRQPIPLSSMLRIHCMQHWFNFSDRQMEDALYEIDSIRRFAGFASVTDALPDEATIFEFSPLARKT